MNMEKKAEALVQRAIELARLNSANGDNGPFGAVVARSGRIVGEGWNRVVEARDPSAHAEIVAIRDACGRLGTHSLSDCRIYCSCEPCPMCMAAIYWARIETVYFACSAADAEGAGFDDDVIRRRLVNTIEPGSAHMIQLCREEGLAVLRSWAANPRKKTY